MTVRPRILVDLSVAPPGGAGTYAAGFVRGLIGGRPEDRADVVVVVDRRWAGANADLVAGLTASGVEVELLALATPGTWRARLGRGRVLRRAIARHRADVAFLPRDVAPRLRGPYVLLANNLYAWRRFDSYGAVGGAVSAALLRRLSERGARRAAAVLAVSRTMAAALPSDLRVTAIVHHGCDLPEAEPAPFATAGPPTVIMVGNVMANKGFEVAIAGVAVARRHEPGWELAVYGGRGDEAYAAQVEEQARAELGAGVLRGPAYGDELLAAYRSADVVAVGGTFESFCFPLVEAMRSGCVVVAPDCDLVDELCGEVAVTYAEGDAESFAAALAVAWDERADRRARGIEAARAFTWTATVAETLSFVRAALDPAAHADRPPPGLR